jgi:hypothetical protein
MRIRVVVVIIIDFLSDCVIPVQIADIIASAVLNGHFFFP